LEKALGTEAWWGPEATIYADCIDLAVNIGVVQFTHILREANKAADELAMKCFIDKFNCIQDDEPPSFTLSKFIDDVSFVIN
jgi:hypothetical protein